MKNKFTKIILKLFLFILILIMNPFSCKDSHKHEDVHKAAPFFASETMVVDSSLADRTNQELYDGRHNAITRAVTKVSDAIVGINVTGLRRVVQRSPFSIDDPVWRSIFPELFRDRVYEQKIKSLGSGFLISPDGYIVTNEHVVENATEILVTMTNGEKYKSEIIGSDKLTDIALLKIDGENPAYIPAGDSNNLIVGEWVIALGNPFGLFDLNDKPTVTVGVISAIDRDWGRSDERLYMDMIQTDAAINHGNSGGPLVNSLGQVIGMNTFIFTGSRYQEGSIGIGFAIPINRIKVVVNEIRERGSIDRDYWLGILDGQDLNPYIVRALNLMVDKGVIITRLERNSPAVKSGLREEDVIIRVNKKAVNSRQDFVTILSNMELKVGDVLNFTIIRDNKELTFKVKLEANPD
jgi:serine protease Do